MEVFTNQKIKVSLYLVPWSRYLYQGRDGLEPIPADTGQEVDHPGQFACSSQGGHQTTIHTHLQEVRFMGLTWNMEVERANR